VKLARLISNRFVLTFGGLALAALLWNWYVGMNDDGRLSGRVTTADGTPVADATVVLSRKTVTSVERVRETRTDAQGRFVFEHHGQYAVVISARKASVGAASRRTIRLWFRDQNRDLETPLILEA
jgi:Carboxypeptidase regulatory-like domain